jgi:cullin 1
MHKDLAAAEQAAATYKEHLAARPAAAAAAGAAFDFSTSVLTTGFWPAFTKVELRLPSAMAAARDEFQAYYVKKATSRRLDWQYSLGSANVAGSWPAAAAGAPPQTYTLTVVTLQAAALLVFGDLADGARLTTAGVAEALGCSPDVAKRTLHSLACGKQRVLTKAPEGAKIAPDDTFGVNPKFSSALKKLQIPMASLDEAAASKKIVDDNREHAIDAALVRIMKARKTLAHSVLVMETITQLLFFKPAPRDIKKRIENLIARDYLERAEEGDNVYKASGAGAGTRADARSVSSQSLTRASPAPPARPSQYLA